LVHNQGSSQVGFIFVLTNVEPVRLSVEFPIDGSNLIAMNVGTMFLEVDAGSNMSGAMHATAQTINHAARYPLEVCDSSEVIRLQPLE
jgi:hypothetical protein